MCDAYATACFSIITRIYEKTRSLNRDMKLLLFEFQNNIASHAATGFEEEVCAETNEGGNELDEAELSRYCIAVARVVYVNPQLLYGGDVQNIKLKENIDSIMAAIECRHEEEEGLSEEEVPDEDEVVSEGDVSDEDGVVSEPEREDEDDGVSEGDAPPPADIRDEYDDATAVNKGEIVEDNVDYMVVDDIDDIDLMSIDNNLNNNNVIMQFADEMMLGILGQKTRS